MKDAYLVHIQPFFCSCGNSWTHSSIFHSSSSGAGTRLEAVGGIDKAQEMIGLSHLQPRKVPCCSLCIGDLMTAHNAAAAAANQQWEEMLARRRADEEIARELQRAKAKAKPSSAPSTAPTIDEL